MSNKICVLCFFFVIILGATAYSQSMPDSTLKVVIIRHGEKPVKGSNLSCRGLNRSLELPAVLIGKFGQPEHIYVPSMKMGDKTAHARMFQTVVPLAVRYNLAISSQYEEKDTTGIATEIKTQKGVLLLVWEHSMIPALAHQLGVTEDLQWPSDDYDSIWIVTYANGHAQMKKDKERLMPSDECP